MRLSLVGTGRYNHCSPEIKSAGVTVINVIDTRVSTENLRKLLLVRLIVATLGERTSPPWWKTQFLSDVGLRGMARIFPRTALSAALNSVITAAQADHDKRIGRDRYHLFRFPTAMEHAARVAVSDELFQREGTALIAKGQNALLQELEKLANGRVISPAEGPISVGTANRLTEASGVKELAAFYKTAVETHRRAFPYFDQGVRA